MRKSTQRAAHDHEWRAVLFDAMFVRSVHAIGIDLEAEIVTVLEAIREANVKRREEVRSTRMW